MLNQNLKSITPTPRYGVRLLPARRRASSSSDLRASRSDGDLGASGSSCFSRLSIQPGDLARFPNSIPRSTHVPQTHPRLGSGFIGDHRIRIGARNDSGCDLDRTTFSIFPEFASRSTTLSERLLAMSRRSPLAPASNAQIPPDTEVQFLQQSCAAQTQLLSLRQSTVERS